jgi:hypothetical protein
MGDSANPDVEVINAVRPGLSTIPYSLLLIASSPYVKRGILYTNYAKYFGKDDAPVLVWQSTTEEMNSTLIGDSLVEEIYLENPNRASAEFGAQFRSDIVAFITKEAVVAHGVREFPPAASPTRLSWIRAADRRIVSWWRSATWSRPAQQCWTQSGKFGRRLAPMQWLKSSQRC